MGATRLLPGLAAAALAAAVAAGCGEKDEPAPSAPEPAPATRTSENDVLADISGAWSGTLRQKGTKPFEVRALIHNPEDPRESTVHYDGIDCSGTWTVSRVRGQTVRFFESIDRGEDGDCKGSGTVEITPLPGDEELEYEFTGGGVESSGILRRVED